MAQGRCIVREQINDDFKVRMIGQRGLGIHADIAAAEATKPSLASLREVKSASGGKQSEVFKNRGPHAPQGLAMTRGAYLSQARSV